MDQFPWTRVARGLAQFARQEGVTHDSVANVVRVLRRLLPLCGDASRSRKMAYRIGKTLMEPPVQIFVPVCPDYSHTDGKYTFERMGSGIPLLFQRHCDFVMRLSSVLKGVSVVILLADHERSLQHLRGVLRITDEDFERKILGSLSALQAAVPAHWEVKTFTSFFPSFEERVWDKAQMLLGNSEYQAALESDTIARTSLYDKIGYSKTQRVRLMCTAHVAAQYVCLGEEAERARALICNHTTTSLRWYLQTSTGILHNPVSVY